jgi:short-subunit dehydrogenase
VVIYNAGLMLYDDLLYVEEDDIDAMYEVMVKGYLFLCQEIIPIMRKQGYGYIINISSTRGIAAAPNKSAYSAMKRAAVSLTDSIRIENKQYGIKATSVHFGIVDTDSSRKKYGKNIRCLNPVKESSVSEMIRALLLFSNETQVDSIIVGGKL